MQLPAIRSPRFLFLLGMAVYTLTAWRSEGYHHPDEYFQILEFANYRLGRTPADGLPWEFEAQIRPGLQPMLAFASIRVAEAAGVDNPFTQAFLLRLLSGWLCLWLFFLWAKFLEKRNPNWGNWLRLAAVLLWFVPYLSVRFSSENWAGLSFGFGLLLLLTAGKGRGSARANPTPGPSLGGGGRRSSLTSEEEKDNIEGVFATSPLPIGGGVESRAGLLQLQLVIAGFLLALSFFFRFQMGFALAGLGAWWVFQSWKPGTRVLTPQWTSLAALLFGGALAAALGIWADVWLYGKPVFTAFKYFYANIVQDVAASWGTSPGWYYPVETLLTAVPPVSLVLLTLLGFGLWHERKSALVWCLVPFLLAHTAVGHKELRFVFPMLLPVLVLAVQGLAAWKSGKHIPAWVMRSARIIWPVALGLNFLLLPARCLLAAQDSAPYYRFLYDYAATRSVPVLVVSRENCLYESVGLPIYFYCSPNVENRVVRDFQSGMLLAEPAPDRLILSPRLTLTDSLRGLRTERIYTYFPDWILWFNLNDWQSRSRIWSVYRYEQAGKPEH